MRNIHIISINHQTHSSDERISLNLTVEKWDQLFKYLKYSLGVEGYVHLRTCNRIELCYESANDYSQQIIMKWLSFADICIDDQGSKFQLFTGYKDCIDHLLHLSVGFKSAIYGDDQILSQLKKAFEAARVSNAMSTLLERAYQTLMRFHKEICRTTDFKSQTVSLAYQALKSARNKIGTKNLKTKNVLIIGAGDMAAQVVKYSVKFKFGSISITNRTLCKAESLVKSTSIKVVPYSNFDFDAFDIIISCTDQGYYLLDDFSGLEYYIDLSLCSAQISQMPVEHILLHQLQELINEQNRARMQSVETVYQILTEKAEEYLSWCKDWNLRRQIADQVEIHVG